MLHLPILSLVPPSYPLHGSLNLLQHYRQSRLFSDLPFHSFDSSRTRKRRKTAKSEGNNYNFKVKTIFIFADGEIIRNFTPSNSEENLYFNFWKEKWIFGQFLGIFFNSTNLLVAQMKNRSRPLRVTQNADVQCWNDARVNFLASFIDPPSNEHSET